jgi:hypothetical protein
MKAAFDPKATSADTINFPQAGASMKRRAFLWIIGWAAPHNMTMPTTIIGQATIAALSIRRTY